VEVGEVGGIGAMGEDGDEGCGVVVGGWAEEGGVGVVGGGAGFEEEDWCGIWR
jgi:hypothetical protein